MTTYAEDMRVSFLRRVSQASSEACRLQFLYHDVCWYEAQRQHDRWLPTAAAAYLEQITLDRYFTGLCCDAPPCPPEIVRIELEDARAHLQECIELVEDLKRYAPGGEGYEEARESFQDRAADAATSCEVAGTSVLDR